MMAMASGLADMFDTGHREEPWHQPWQAGDPHATRRSQLSWICSPRGSRLATGFVVRLDTSQGRANCPGHAVPEVPDWPPWHQTWQTSLGTGDSSSPPPHLKVICSCSFYWTVLSLDGEPEAALIIMHKHTNLRCIHLTGLFVRAVFMMMV